MPDAQETAEPVPGARKTAGPASDVRQTARPVDEARETVLARIRAAKPSTPVEVPRDYRRAGELAPGSPQVLDLFVERLTDYKATVVRTTAADLPSHLPPGEGLLVPPGLPPEWTPPGATVDDGLLTPTELDSFTGVLTCCAAAVAETGTIALDASPGQGRRALTLVPDRHFCVVRADQVVHTVPDLLHRLDPARPLTLISGPSATSDIELNRVEGVHGPRTLIVLLIDSRLGVLQERQLTTGGEAADLPAAPNVRRTAGSTG